MLDLQPRTTTTTTLPSTKMASRPTVTIAGADGKPTGATYPLPAVFASPIRLDVVQYVFFDVEPVSKGGAEDG